MPDADDGADADAPEAGDYRHQLGLIDPKLLTKILDVSIHTLKEWRLQDKGPNYVVIGKRVWYLYDDVLSWIEDNRHMTTQRRDYSKMTPHEHDTQKPTQKAAFPVAHQPVPPPTPEQVNAPPEATVVAPPRIPPDEPTEAPDGDDADDDADADDETQDAPDSPPDNPTEPEPAA